ncbi:MAG: DUF2190 family protein [Actinomycetia bacterium]|nr:DUF2190 family protein [Actinomycetes bacterium]
MALNQRYTESKHITLTAPKEIKAGDPVRVGGFVGVAQTSAKSGERVTVWLDGSYDLTVEVAVNEGDLVYLTSDGKLNKTAASNTPFGLALAKTSGKGTVEVAPLGKIATAGA